MLSGSLAGRRKNHRNSPTLAQSLTRLETLFSQDSHLILALNSVASDQTASPTFQHALDPARPPRQPSELTTRSFGVTMEPTAFRSAATDVQSLTKIFLGLPRAGHRRDGDDDVGSVLLRYPDGRRASPPSEQRHQLWDAKPPSNTIYVIWIKEDKRRESEWYQGAVRSRGCGRQEMLRLSLCRFLLLFPSYRNSEGDLPSIIGSKLPAKLESITQVAKHEFQQIRAQSMHQRW